MLCSWYAPLFEVSEKFMSISFSQSVSSSRSSSWPKRPASLCLLWNSGCWRGSEIYECEMASCVDGAEHPFSNTHEHMQQQCCIYELDREDFHPPIVCTTQQCCVPLNHDVCLDVMFIIKCPIYLLAISMRISTNISYGSEVSSLPSKKV